MSYFVESLLEVQQDDINLFPLAADEVISCTVDSSWVSHEYFSVLVVIQDLVLVKMLHDTAIDVSSSLHVMEVREIGM